MQQLEKGIDTILTKEFADDGVVMSGRAVSEDTGGEGVCILTDRCWYLMNPPVHLTRLRSISFMKVLQKPDRTEY